VRSAVLDTAQFKTNTVVSPKQNLNIFFIRNEQRKTFESFNMQLD